MITMNPKIKVWEASWTDLGATKGLKTKPFSLLSLVFITRLVRLHKKYSMKAWKIRKTWVGEKSQSQRYIRIHDINVYSKFK